jgi:hypothetical protein
MVLGLSGQGRRRWEERRTILEDGSVLEGLLEIPVHKTCLAEDRGAGERETEATAC